MFPAEFDYYRAASLEEAVALLGLHQGAKVLAGGHSLLPMMKLRLAQPPTLIDIGRIAALRGISRDGDRIRIGALTPHAEIAASELLARDCPILAEAAGKIGDPQVRNRGTIGGNIAHADPASDLPAVLVALGATVLLTGARGPRRVAAADFFVDLLTSDVQPDEVLTAVEVAPLPPRSGSAYLKREHPASGYAVCGAAAIVTLGGDGRCERAALAFNGVAPKAFRASAVGEALAGKAPDAAAITAAIGRLAVEDPLGDLYASPEYRVELARVYGRRALEAAVGRARG
jgi:aerobic carbon-monoxide dehydrogenase medium subunit